MTILTLCAGSAAAIWIASKVRNKAASSFAIGAGYLVLAYALIDAAKGLGRFF